MARNTPPPEEIEKTLGVGGRAAGSSRRLTAAVGLALAALLAVALWYWLAGSSTENTQYVTQPVVRDKLTVTVTATGTVEPTNTVEVSSELSGTVRKVLADHNDTVKKGEVLAELDTDKLKAEVARYEAAVAAAKARVAEAEATIEEQRRKYERLQRLAEKEYTSRQDLETAEASYNRALATLQSARADVAVAEAQLSVNRTNLAKACICSPISGVVLQRNLEPGQYVATSLQAPVLFTVAEDLKQMELEVDIDEADIGTVREGQKARFTVDAYPDRTFPASIEQIRYAPETVAGVVTYKAVLTVDNSDLLLRPGMTATAEITVQNIEDALLVPNAALRFSPPQESASGEDRSFLERLIPSRPRFREASRQATDSARQLWVLREGEPQSVIVSIGASDGSRTEITEGPLNAGEMVIVGTASAAR